jgi:hypothetical protein
MPFDRTIVRAAIHPAIGVARVGNSPTEYFIGPEVIQAPALSAGFSKDDQGALKRQAARFRIYGYDAAGEVVAELNADNAEIAWTVHVANKKAAWYQFQLALDIPEASTAKPAERRNKTVTDRQKLVIDPGPGTIRGRETSGPEYRLNRGTFWGKPVGLGELRTDATGRLIFLGGYGVSASYDGSRAEDFANNDGWHDDVSDGPVTARLSIDGREIPVDPAWVVVAPPNYAPDILGVRTLYDLLFDTFVQAGRLPFPERISFTRDIYPMLRGFSTLQWVNYGFAVQFGWGGPHDFLDPEYLLRLASNDAQHLELRRQLFLAFRHIERDGAAPLPWPWLYGDAMEIPSTSPRQFLAISPTQYKMLELWALGRFEADWDPHRQLPRTLDDIPLSDQPAMLDRAALGYCLADAFHPGCELTWPVRHATMYMHPFRIRPRMSGESEPDYGNVLTPAIALSVNGPLYAQGPGDLTRWMAVPWQTDTASCRAGYDRKYDPYLPTFWPARVPNHVLTEDNYRTVMNTALPLNERLRAFRERSAWFRLLQGDYLAQINQMVNDFGKLGIVETHEGPEDGSFPRTILVESAPAVAGAPVPPQRGLLMLHVPDADAHQGAIAAAVTSAAEETGRSEEEFVAGTINKLTRTVHRR